LARFDRWIAAASRAALHVAALAALACLLLVCYGVAARYFFGQPQPWVDKVQGWLSVAMVMFAAAEAERRGEHVGVDTLTERAGPAWRRRLAAFGLACTMAVAAIMIWEGWATAAFARMTEMMTDIHGVRLWWLQAMLPVGFGLLLLVALARLLRLARRIDDDPAAADAAKAIRAGPLE
jgi:TRAP-type C4-dicarboxylate transport system permease small subunit